MVSPANCIMKPTRCWLSQGPGKHGSQQRWDTLRFIWQDILRFKVANKKWQLMMNRWNFNSATFIFSWGGCFPWKQKTLGFPDLNVNFTNLLRLFPWSFLMLHFRGKMMFGTKSIYTATFSPGGGCQNTGSRWIWLVGRGPSFLNEWG